MIDKADKSAGIIIVQDGESLVSRRSLAGTNGNGAGTTRNGAGTTQLPAVISEPKEGPKIEASEADRDDTAHDEEGLDVKDTSTLPKARSKRHSLFVVIGIVLLLGVVVGVRYWLHSRQYESTDDAFI